MTFVPTRPPSSRRVTPSGGARQLLVLSLLLGLLLAVAALASFALGALFLLFLYVTKKYRQIPALCLDHPGLEPREQPEAIEPQADLEKPEAQEDGQEPEDRES